jgi:hypothetical protein
VSGKAHNLGMDGTAPGALLLHEVDTRLSVPSGTSHGACRSSASTREDHPHKDCGQGRHCEPEKKGGQKRSVVRRAARVVEQEPVARCFRSERHAASGNVRGCATQWRHENVPESQTPDARQCWPQDVRAASPWKADKHGEPREQKGCADAEQTNDAEQNQADRQRSVSPDSPHVFIVRRTAPDLGARTPRPSEAHSLRHRCYAMGGLTMGG